MKISPFVGILIAFILGLLCMKAWGVYFSLKIPSHETITFFIDDKDLHLPALQLSPSGMLLIDIPLMMKQYEAQKKNPPKAIPHQ